MRIPLQMMGCMGDAMIIDNMLSENHRGCCNREDLDNITCQVEYPKILVERMQMYILSGLSSVIKFSECIISLIRGMSILLQ